MIVMTKENEAYTAFMERQEMGEMAMNEASQF
jgi:hypothetical protein